MKYEQIPLLKTDDVLIVPLRGDLNDMELRKFESSLLERSSRASGVASVVLDVSSLESMDLFMARMLLRLVSKLKVMDLNSVLVGLKPEVAITLLDMGVSFPGVNSASNLEKGLEVLKRLNRK